jgi:hypothetical protein
LDQVRERGQIDSAAVVQMIIKQIDDGIAAGLPAICDCFLRSLTALRRHAVATLATPISQAQQVMLVDRFAHIQQFLTAQSSPSKEPEVARMFSGVQYLIRCWGLPRNADNLFYVHGTILHAAVLCQTAETVLTFLCLTTWEASVQQHLTSERSLLFQELLDTAADVLAGEGEA